MTRGRFVNRPYERIPAMFVQHYQSVKSCYSISIVDAMFIE